MKLNQKIYVTARFRAREDKRNEMIDLLTSLASATGGESGCLEYGYYQASDDSSDFSSFEVWADTASEAAHWQTQHLKDALTRLPGLMDGDAEVTKYTKVA